MYRDYLDEITELMMSCEVYVGTRRIEDWEEGFGAIVDAFAEAKRQNRRVFFIGNGGSAAIASHMTADFMKNGGMRTVNMYDSSLITCMGNDYGYGYVFSKPLEFLGGEGDLLVAVSSSGNSENVVNAIKAAKDKGMKIITFTGFRPDNFAKNAGDYNLYVPISQYGKVESLHNLFLQQIVDVIMEDEEKR